MSNKYDNLEPEEINSKIKFLTSKIEVIRKKIFSLTEEMEGACSEVLYLNELLNGEG